MPYNESALLIFSGGQDSATCLAWALNRFALVHTVGFTYGQRHIVEMDCRQDVLRQLPALRPTWQARSGTDHVLDLGIIGELAESSLTRDTAIDEQPTAVPNSFVPGRNLMFMLTAAALAWRLECRHLIMGVCETDYSGYPDCRDDAVKAMQVAINTGMGARMVIHTPLMWLDKAACWSLAEVEGGPEAGVDLVELVRTVTHTCYAGDRTMHAWGAGCGRCPACVLRAAGWERYSSLSM